MGEKRSIFIGRTIARIRTLVRGTDAATSYFDFKRGLEVDRRRRAALRARRVGA